MNNDLASNIRAFRKERGLTQEQLAEVFGVTVGAVQVGERDVNARAFSHT
jgi:transcriptional regulator with XRE-family HTH domain